MLIYRYIIFVYSVLGGCWSAEQLKFPLGFWFGASTSALQVEGAWNTSGKSEHIWDHLAHTRPELIADGSAMDEACDSYHLWRRDIEMIEELGLNMYRFSVSWTRILPSGFPNYINSDGVKYYSDLIDGLLAKGVEPLITLYHFDLPQSLQDLGGWANPLIVDWFTDYVRVVYSLYADRVKFWMTINEPAIVCDFGYSGANAPAITDTKIGQFLCNKYVLMAHAKAWRIYDKEFKPQFGGKVSIGSLIIWYEPITPDDVEVTDLTIDYWVGRYCHPIYSEEGGWPPKLEKLLAENAKREGFSQPRLIPFTKEEIELVRGTYDYHTLNHYSSRMVRKARPGEEPGFWPLYGSDEIGVVIESHPNWENTSIDWFEVYPSGLRHMLHWLKNSYGAIDIIISENGYPSLSARLNDQKRTEYIKGFLEQILLSINDGIPVIGYNVWSLMDNYEFLGGYTMHFGLYAVNFSDPLRTRTPRDSARYYSTVTRSRMIQPTHAPNLGSLPTPISSGAPRAVFNTQWYIARSLSINMSISYICIVVNFIIDIYLR